jgi:hypothetical protein
MSKPGRKPIDAEGSVHVGVTLPKKQFDEYAVRAIEEDVSVPEIIRRELDSKKSKNQSA